MTGNAVVRQAGGDDPFMRKGCGRFPRPSRQRTAYYLNGIEGDASPTDARDGSGSIYWGSAVKKARGGAGEGNRGDKLGRRCGQKSILPTVTRTAMRRKQ